MRGSLTTFSGVQSNAQVSQNLSRWKFFAVDVKFPRWGSLHLPMCLQSYRAAASEASPTRGVLHFSTFITTPRNSASTIRSGISEAFNQIPSQRWTCARRSGEGDGLLCRDSATNAVLTVLAPTQTVDSKPLESYSQTQIQHRNG